MIYETDTVPATLTTDLDTLAELLALTGRAQKPVTLGRPDGSTIRVVVRWIVNGDSIEASLASDESRPVRMRLDEITSVAI